MWIDYTHLSHILKEDYLLYKSDVKILDELSTAFAPGGPCESMTFADLELLAEHLFHRWMSVKAYVLAVSPRLRDGLGQRYGCDGGQIPDMAQSCHNNTAVQVQDNSGEIEMTES